MLDALEQYSCNPGIACFVTESLHRILQLSPEKTISSLKTLNAMQRVLKVTCIQAQEYKRSCTKKDSPETLLVITPVEMADIPFAKEQVQLWLKTMQASTHLFTDFLSKAEDARVLVLHNSVCIDCLFELFWEESFRSSVLTHITELMKVSILSLSIICYKKLKLDNLIFDV